mgnify:CR=1 FL=1
MATKTYQVEKLKPGRKTLPCRGRDCDIRTNKRYRAPAATVYVACMISHAEKAYLRDLSRQQKALALAAA